MTALSRKGKKRRKRQKRIKRLGFDPCISQLPTRYIPRGLESAKRLPPDNAYQRGRRL